MESAIARNLRPEFEPVAVVWSDHIPDHAFQFKKGKFGCVLYLFAEASRGGKIAGGDRESIICTGGRTAVGFGCEFDASEEVLDRHAALFSKGLKSARDQEAYRAYMDAAPKNWHDMLQYGERRHGSSELARQWIQHGLPRHDIPHQYVLFKPLGRVAADDDLRAVIFPVSPVELSGLITLAGSVMPGIDPVQAPPGPDCCGITAFAYAQASLPQPRAVLGMLGTDGREMMHRRFRDDILTLTLPATLYQRMEQEANDCIFQTPAWRAISRYRDQSGK